MRFSIKCSSEARTLPRDRITVIKAPFGEAIFRATSQVAHRRKLAHP